MEISKVFKHPVWITFSTKTGIKEALVKFRDLEILAKYQQDISTEHLVLFVTAIAASNNKTSTIVPFLMNKKHKTTFQDFIKKFNDLLESGSLIYDVLRIEICYDYALIKYKDKDPDFFDYSIRYESKMEWERLKKEGNSFIEIPEERPYYEDIGTHITRMFFLNHQFLEFLHELVHSGKY